MRIIMTYMTTAFYFINDHQDDMTITQYPKFTFSPAATGDTGDESEPCCDMLFMLGVMVLVCLLPGLRASKLMSTLVSFHVLGTF
jgi:hypothetical protein